MGIALLRERIADGWWILRLLLLMNVGGDMYADVAAEEMDSEGVICGCIWDCRGEDSGDPLDSDERSDEPDVTD